MTVPEFHFPQLTAEDWHLLQVDLLNAQAKTRNEVWQLREKMVDYQHGSEMYRIYAESYNSLQRAVEKQTKAYNNFNDIEM